MNGREPGGKVSLIIPLIKYNLAVLVLIGDWYFRIPPSPFIFQLHTELAKAEYQKGIARGHA